MREDFGFLRDAARRRQRRAAARDRLARIRANRLTRRLAWAAAALAIAAIPGRLFLAWAVS